MRESLIAIFHNCLPASPLNLNLTQLLEASEKVDVDLATLRALIDIESNGKGFLANGKPSILFEGHVFFREIKFRGFDTTSLMKKNPDILQEKWTGNHYLGGANEYLRLEKAINISAKDDLLIDAALCSCSWGLFQIMGFNYAPAGCTSIESFVLANCQNELNQLRLFINFIQEKNMLKYLQNKDWLSFALSYNGKFQAKNNYSERLSAAYLAYKKK